MDSISSVRAEWPIIKNNNKDEETMNIKDLKTALHWAAFTNDIRTAEFLINSEEYRSHNSVAMTNSHHMTPLHCVIIGQTSIGTDNESCKAMAQILIKSEGIHDIPNPKNGWTLMHYAARYENITVAKLLLDNGAEFDTATDDYGTTPLSISAEQGCESIAEIIMEKGASLEGVKLHDYTRYPILHKAVRNHNIEVVKVLLRYGANPFLEDQYQNTPRTLSVHVKNKEMERLLKKAEKEWEAKENGGNILEKTEELFKKYLNRDE